MRYYLVIGVLVGFFVAPLHGTKVTLACSDDVEYAYEDPADIAIIKKSTTLRNMLEDLGEDNDEKIPLPDVTGETFDKIFTLLKQFYDVTDDKKKFYESLMEVQGSLMYAVILGLNYLNVPEVLRAVIKVAAQRWFSSDSLRKIIDLDDTPQDKAQLSQIPEEIFKLLIEHAAISWNAQRVLMELEGSHEEAAPAHTEKNQLELEDAHEEAAPVHTEKNQLELEDAHEEAAPVHTEKNQVLLEPELQRNMVSVHKKPGSSATWVLRQTSHGEELIEIPTANNDVRIGYGGNVFAEGRRKGSIRIWDTHTGTMVCQLNGDTTRPHGSLSFSPENRYLASATTENKIVVWDVKTGERVHTLGIPQNMHCLDFSPDGSKIAFARLSDQWLNTWALGASNPDMADVGGGIFSVHFRAGFITVMRTITDEETGQHNVIIQLVDSETLEKKQRFVLEDVGHMGRFGLEFGSNGRLMAVCEKKNIHVWEVASGELLKKVTCVAKPSTFWFEDDYLVKFVAMSGTGETARPVSRVISLIDSELLKNLTLDQYRLLAVAQQKKQDGGLLELATQSFLKRVFDELPQYLRDYLRGKEMVDLKAVK